jgi:hypothetical protein
LVSFPQPEKSVVPELTVKLLCGIVISVRAVHPENTPLPKDVAFERFRVVNAVQLLNAEFPTV